MIQSYYATSDHHVSSVKFIGGRRSITGEDGLRSMEMMLCLCSPAKCELSGPVRGELVLGGVGVRLVPDEVEQDADRPLLGGLVLVAVDLDGGGVGEEEVVAGDVGLGGGVPAEAASGAPAGGEEAVAVAVGGHHPGLVDGEPVLHPVAVRLEAEVGEVGEVRPAN